METFYTSIPEFIVKTDDITKLTNRACDNLKLGDEVILLDGDKQTKYNITSKSVDGMKLGNITGEAVIEVIYSKEGNDWSYVETKTTELGGGTSLKIGDYILNEDTGKYEWVEELPEDFSGHDLYIDKYEFGLYQYENGNEIRSVSFDVASSLVSLIAGSETTNIGSDGTDKLNFALLTHSFNELGPTLKQIVDDAITDNFDQGVACTQAQWNAIKSLLDKSLYLNYNSFSMIKSLFNGISMYIFGMMSSNDGELLTLNYEATNSLLFAKYSEV